MASVLYLLGRCSPKNTLTSCQKLIPITESSHGCPQVCLTFIRWRKPRWLPKAPSKIYKVRKPTPIDPVEHEELKKLYKNYRSHMKAVKKFLVNWSEEEALSTVDVVGPEQAKKDEFVQLLEENRLWNEDVAKHREARQSEEAVLTNQALQTKLADAIILESESVAVADEAIRKEKGLVGTFITADNLDDEIEKMLNSREHYDFAINLQGERLHMHEVLPRKPPTSKELPTDGQNEIRLSS